jgi:hypothetical protein
MRTWVSVARYHLVRPAIFVGMPWAIMAFSFVVNLIIFRLVPPSSHAVQTGHGVVQVMNTSHYTGAVAIIYVFFFIMGVFGTGASLPFGLALGVSRRSYYTGTALLAVALAAADGLALTVLQAIERATGGWGEDLHFFRVPYLLDGPWYLTWLTSFVGLALLFVYGMWFGIVYRRWSIAGNVTFIAAQVTVLLAVALLITWVHGWTGVGHFFTALSAAGLTGLLAALTAALLAGGYATVRRVTV